MSKELKMCPFCGSEAAVDFGYKADEGHYVACTSCQANVGKGLDTSGGLSWAIFQTIDEAIEAWNNRMGSADR